MFLAQRSLSSAADAAALSGAQSVDRTAIYRGRAAVAPHFPLDLDSAIAAVAASLDDAGDGLRQTFVTLSEPDVEISGDTVRVHLRGAVTLPFGRMLALLLPDHPDGRVSVQADARTRSAPAC